VPGDAPDAAGANASPAQRAIVIAARAVIRSGNLRARLPGPPRGYLERGTSVRLLDRAPVTFGKGVSATEWLAIEPPVGAAYYVRAEGTRAVAGIQPAAAEVRTAYDRVDGQRAPDRNSAGPIPPAELTAELASIEAMQREIISRPIEQWRFEEVRRRYQALLKRSADDRAAEEAIRIRLLRVTGQEQAAKAAATIQTTLAQSHRRDHLVEDVERRLAGAGRTGPRAYHAVGLLKPSSRMVDGRRLYTLIAADGSTVAFLDMPPGLDPEPLLTRRVGVRGVAHYNEALSARLITVRAMDSLESKR
jgi:hypothetical protein